MTAPGSARPPADPSMQEWIDRQKAKFTSSDLDRAVQLIRGYRRARERAAQESIQQGSAA